MDITDVFNSKLKEFIADLSNVCPELCDMSPLLSLTIAMDKNAAINMFNTTIAINYENHIMNKDDQFFLNEPYNGDVPNIGIDLVNNLKHVWTTLDSNNKETIWKYLQLLLILNNKKFKCT